MGVIILFNQIFLGKTRNLLSIILVNLPLLLLAGIAPLVFYQYSVGGLLWPAIVPVLFEIIILWPIAGVFLINKPLPKQRMVSFELGLIILGLFLALETVFKVPYLGAVVSAFVTAGIVLEATVNSEGTYFLQGHDFKKRWIPLLASIGLAGSGLAFGWLIVTKGFTELMQRFVYFLIVVIRVIAHKFDLLGLNRKIGETNTLKLPGYVPVELESTGLNVAPLWVMIILWTILALLLVVTTLVIVSSLRRFLGDLIRDFRAIEIELKPQKRRLYLRKIDLKMILSLFQYFRSYLRFIIKIILIKMFGIRPTTVNELYIYFLYWGKKIGWERLPAETPEEYLNRLAKVLEVNNQNHSLLLNELTEAFYKERYGGLNCNLSKEDIIQVSKELQMISSLSLKRREKVLVI